MIILNDISTPPITTALVLTPIIASCIISCFLNPIVFFYNKKKTSIAGLLFCVLSALDFVVCLLMPAYILYYATATDMDKVMCFTAPRQPQNCYREAVPTDNIITICSLPFICFSFSTTGVLAAVRSIQIKFPLYPIRKLHVLFTLLIVGVFQIGFWVIIILFDRGERRFYLAVMAAMTTNPFGFHGDFRRILASMIMFIPLSFVQLLAVVASIITAITLIQARKSVSVANLSKNRTSGAVKVLLTNLPSFIYALTFGTPIVGLIYHDTDGFIKFAGSGWLAFSEAIMLPLLSSVWNPIVFLALTPKSRRRPRNLSSLIQCWKHQM